MDCGTVSNLLARYACVMNNTMVDELVGLSILGLLCVSGIVLLVKAFIAGWRSTPAK